MSSADVPLSSTPATRRAKSTARSKSNAKGKAVAELPSAQEIDDLDERFFRMIRDDTALWVRILRYEVC